MKKPQIVEEWEASMESIERMVPKCCYTCYELTGKNCRVHGEIPDDFLSKIDECTSHSREAF